MHDIQRKASSMEKQPLWTKAFILMTGINLLLFCGFQMLLPTLPLYAKSLGGADAILGWVTGAVTVSSLLIRPVSGMMLDKLGRKGVLLAGVGLMALIPLAFLWAQSVWALILVRFLHGLGWGIASTAASTIATDIIPKQRLGEGMGYFSLSSSIAMALSPGIGLTLYGKSGIASALLCAAALGAASLCVSFFIRTGKPEAPPESAPPSPSSRPAPYEKSSVAPSAVMFFVSATYGSITGFLSLYAADRGILNIGVFFTVYAVSLLLFRPVSGKLTDRFGFSRVIYPGLAVLMAALIVLSFADTLVYFLLCAVLYGIGFSAVQSSLQTMAVIRAPKERRGAANATFFTGFDGGIGFGAVIAGVLVSIAGYANMYLLFSLLLVIAALLFLLISRKPSASIGENTE